MSKIENLLRQMQTSNKNALNRSHQDRYSAISDDLENAYPSFKSPPVSKN